MAVRPKRKAPISTRPIYLPRVPAKELAGTAAAAAPAVAVYIDGSSLAVDGGELARRWTGALDRPAAFLGEVVSALAGRPQTEVRDLVAAAAHRLAWARIRDPSVRDYRVLPLRGEADREEARLRARSQPEYENLRAPPPAADALYDAAEVQDVFREMLSGAAGEGVARVVITDRRLAVWAGDRGAWVPQAVLQGDPLVLCVTAGGVDPDQTLELVRKALAG